jgi:hypothetical protein
MNPDIMRPTMNTYDSTQATPEVRSASSEGGGTTQISTLANSASFAKVKENS